MNRIKELRKGKKLTQVKLCQILNIAQPTLSGYETGTFEPDNITMAKIADYFGVSIDYLLGREEPQGTPPAQALTDAEKKLMELIGEMTDEEVDELSNFIDFIISKRK